MRNILDSIQAKIVSWDLAKDKTAAWQTNNEKVVFTNGCFDLIHYGHIHYLSEARGLGDRLVIGVNSTASVNKLKGSHRPIKDEKTRLFQLAAMEFVDMVVVFDQDTPYDLIEKVQPDILVKGGDWSIDQIVGADIVLQRGGKVESLQFVDGYSTTAIEQKIKNSISD